jgi:hypothetical protein
MMTLAIVIMAMDVVLMVSTEASARKLSNPKSEQALGVTSFFLLPFK